MFLITLTRRIACSCLALICTATAASANKVEVNLQLKRTYTLKSGSNQALCANSVRPQVLTNDDGKQVLELGPSEGFILTSEQSQEVMDDCRYVTVRKIDRSKNKKIEKIVNDLTTFCGSNPKPESESHTVIKLEPKRIELKRDDFTCIWVL